MKKERIIKISVLSVVFVVALIVFSYVANRGSSNMTADMGSPTLPTISFSLGDKQINMLVGHKKELPAIVTRDAIMTFGDDGILKANIQNCEHKINAFTYEIFRADGEEKLREETIKGVKESANIEVERVLKREQEGLLKITLETQGQKVYYYTRIIRDNKYHLKECLKFANDFHNNALKGEHEDTIRKVLETNDTSKNNTLQHVNIHSDVNHVMWGELNPTLVSEPSITVTETKEAYTSIVLRYQVSCKSDENADEIYEVKEFFKVLYKNGKCYLLEYDRTVEEFFDASNKDASRKGLMLGIANEKLSYKVSDNGKQVAFIQAGELWSYNQENHTVSLLFSFTEAEEDDIRNHTDKHSINIHKIDNKGNVTFSVCGYMNRGSHEGESGAAIYYYNVAKNVLEEKCFIQGKAAYSVLEKELTEFVYFNTKKEELYLVAGDNLIAEQEILLKGIGKRGFVSSDDGQFVAYYKGEGEKRTIEVVDLESENKWEVKPEEGQILIPLGFVSDDFVYGISSEEMVGQDVFGNPVQAMYRLEIRDQKQNVVKSYEKLDSNILGVTIDKNVIQIHQGYKRGNTYVEAEDDHITNNEVENGKTFLQSYWSDSKQTQYRLTFSNDLKNKRPKTLKPKLVLQEKELVIEADEKLFAEYYYVYGHGVLAGACEDSGQAVELAETNSGVVVTAKQNYVWEADNRVAWYRNFNVERFSSQSGESGLTACVRKVLSFEGKVADESLNLDLSSAKKLIGSQLEVEAILLHGNSVRDLCYLMSKDVLVIAMKENENAILLVGYDVQTITYVDPSSGVVSTQTIEKVDDMLKGSGNTFLAYIK